MNRDLLRRVVKLEAFRRHDAPTRILADRPIGDDEATVMLKNWRDEIASGRGSLSGDVLCIIGPEMTETEWVRTLGFHLSGTSGHSTSCR